MTFTLVECKKDVADEIGLFRLTSKLHRVFASRSIAGYLLLMFRLCVFRASEALSDHTYTHIHTHTSSSKHINDGDGKTAARKDMTINFVGRTTENPGN